MPARVAKITLICTYGPCQTPFEVLPWRVGRAKYCSKRCHMLANHPQRDMTLADRFWEKVIKASPDECWIWTASKGSTGYGMIWTAEQERLVGAHVVSWYLEHGTWPPEDQCVLHNCPDGDQPACVNPAHLWLGTRTTNGFDMVNKGRHANQFGRVTLAQREEIIALYANGGWTYEQLGERFGLNPMTVYTYVKAARDTIAIPSQRERAARGERIHNAKLTDAQWQEALGLYATGEWSIRRLAQRYRVNRTSIKNRLKHQL
jgi:DNA-binding CsgD family transcriptional regulator